jgi:Tol biopolymer transport system component
VPRIADVLERESRSVDLEPGDFERLLGRRERKERNRRLRAGAVGVAVALAIGVAFARSLPSEGIPADRSDEPKPAPAAPGTFAYVLDGDVYVADRDGSNAVRIADGLGEDRCDSTDGSSFWAEGAMWSPDGRYLAYRRTDCPGGPSSTKGDVVISDAAGNVLATFPAAGWGVGWSPDSSRVAVWESLFETVGVYGVDGAQLVRIAMPDRWDPPGDVDPQWMLDGTSLYVDPGVELPLGGRAPRRAPGGAPSDRAGDADGFDIVVDDGALLLVRTDGSGSVTLYTAERGTDLEGISVSPEGDRVLFSKIEDGEPSLWSIAVDGSDARLLVAGTTQGQWLSR